jgi:competence protein ComEC
MRRAVVLLLALLPLATGCRREAVAPVAPPGTLSVLYLALPRGDAALVQAPGGEALLVDGGGGGDGASLEALLRRRGVTRLTGAVATHPDPAHVEGLLELLQSVPVGWLMDSGFPDLSAPGTSRELARSVAGRLARRITELASGRATEYRLGRAGQEIPLAEAAGGSPGVTLQVLGPSEPFITGSGADADNASIVFRLVHGRVRFLFTGGMGLRAQERILASPEADRLPADVFQVPDGGGPIAAELLARVAPRLAILGRPGRPPEEKSLALLAKSGARVLRLERGGSLQITSDGETLQVQEGRKGATDVDGDG